MDAKTLDLFAGPRQRGKRAPSPSEALSRVLARVERVGECLIWLGAKNAAGYGKFGFGRRKNLYVHRFVCEMVHGLKPDQVAMHSCDTPSCINPDHIRPGTHLDNARDAMAKGRHKPPPPNGDHLAKLSREGLFKNAKLRPDDIRAIRALLAQGKKLAEIGVQFGVGGRAVSKIKLGQRWAHVT